MLGIMMQVGAFKFSLSTAAYQEFSRSTGYRWEGQSRYGQIPAQQYTGPGEDSITLAGDIYPSFAGGIHQIDAMRAYAVKGQPLMLVDGNGYVWGFWVIQSIDENQVVFFQDGTPRKQTFNMKLTRYIPDLTPAANNSWISDIQMVRIR